MKAKTINKLISACEVDFEELKENLYRTEPTNDDVNANINALLIQRIRKNINSRLLKIEQGRYHYD